MAHHNSNDFEKMLDKAREFGCRIEEVNGNTIKVYPQDKSLPLYTCHRGLKAMHPLRRFLKNVCKFAV